MKKPRYHLRFQILPSKNEEKDAAVLAQFCKTHHIEEVVLFFSAEEWNQGLLSKKEEDRWFYSIQKTKAILDRAGIITSLNPWMTVLHSDRGRSFPKDRPFEAMISPTGEKSKACASFADPQWQNYITQLYGRFAQLGFRVIWVEDDFRYHNHTPLTWGCGFEASVLKRFSKKIGLKASRESVIKNILKPGPPHPWRKLWLENWREIQCEVAQKITRAVEANSNGKTRMGLMSSVPTIHSAEGRDWKKLFKALSIKGEVVHRPNYAHYSDVCGSEKRHSMMMLDLQKNFRPSRCEVAPELENWPFTHWSKSDSMTWVDMAIALFHGSDAILLDIFTFSGNRADEEPLIGKMLDQSRPALKWIADRFGKHHKSQGVGMPWTPEAGQKTVTDRGEKMEELYVWPFEGGHFLLDYGIPVSAQTQKVNAVFGKTARCLSASEIRSLLKGGLMLDGLAAHIFCQRGFSSLIGVKIPKFVTREAADYSIEMVTHPQTGIKHGFYFGHNSEPSSVAQLIPLAEAVEWTELQTAAGKRFGSATVGFKNKWGGRVFTMAMTDPNAGIVHPKSDQKQILIQNAVRFISTLKIPHAQVSGGPHLLPQYFQKGKESSLVVFNGSPDAVRPAVSLNQKQIKNVKATLLVPLSKPKSIPVKVATTANGIELQINRKIPYLSFVVLEWKN